jgi:hypothetical protein
LIDTGYPKYIYIYIYLGHRRAVVSKPRLDMCSREALRYPELKDRIELNKIRDHFICMYISIIQ